jgi:hypothetical protein
MSGIFGSAPQAPNYGPLLNMLQQQGGWAQQLAQQQFQWAKDTYQKNYDQNQGIIDLQKTIMQDQSDFAKLQEQQYKDVYMPLQKKFADQAQNFNNPNQQASDIGRAQSAVAQQFDQARRASQQQLESFGINPGSTRYAALDIGARTQQAAASAAAGNQAYYTDVATGMQLEGAALGQGSLIPGQVAGGYNTAMQAGSGAANIGLATTASGANTMGTTMGYMGLGNQALGLMGSTMNQQYQNQMQQYNANNQWWSGLGQLAGVGAGMFGGSGMFGQFGAFALAEGGRVPDPSEVKLFPDNAYVLLHAYHPEGHHMEPHEAMRHFFMTGEHIGAFRSPEEAHEHLQRTDYSKRGRADHVQKFDVGGPVQPGNQMMPPGGPAPSAGPATQAVPISAQPAQALPAGPPPTPMPTTQAAPAVPVGQAGPAPSPSAMPMTQAVPAGPGNQMMPPRPAPSAAPVYWPGGQYPGAWGGPQAFAEGGDVLDRRAGGAVPVGASPSHGAVTDDVPAQVNAGEFVIPKDVTNWKGEEFFQNLINKSRDAKMKAPAKPQTAPTGAIPAQQRPQAALPLR